MKQILLLAHIILLIVGCNNNTDVPIKWTQYSNNPVFLSE